MDVKALALTDKETQQAKCAIEKKPLSVGKF
jgi:hypothetical protein